MALFIASAASIVPRFLEYCGETNEIVTQYLERSNSPEEQARQIAWTEAINRIKHHGVWHSGLVASKIFGDTIILFTAAKLLYGWLEKLFVFLRRICSQSKEELIAQLSAIKDRVIEFYRSLVEMNDLVVTSNDVAGGVVPIVTGTTAVECGGFSLSPITLLKNLWKFLNSSYSYVVQWLFALKGQFTFEMIKYKIQICGCISYYLELLDKFWQFGLN
jgi:hypothetical protein